MMVPLLGSFVPELTASFTCNFPMHPNNILRCTGPIVRVTPHEVHIKDPSFFDQLYCAASEGARDKYQPAAHMTGTPEGSEQILYPDIYGMNS